MIEYIVGTYTESGPGYIVVEASGVGYEIIFPDIRKVSLPDIGGKVKIYIFMSIRENDITLYGFLSRDEYDMFKLLKNVDGVGASIAHGIVSNLSLGDIIYAIKTSDIALLSTVPRVGQSKAELIIVKLKKKVDGFSVAASDGIKATNPSVLDAIDVLKALGFQSNDIQRMIGDIGSHDGLTSSEIVRLALKQR